MDNPFYPLNARVHHTGHGFGRVVAYSNGQAQPAKFAILPYVVKFDSGFRESYSHADLRLIPPAPGLRP